MISRSSMLWNLKHMYAALPAANRVSQIYTQAGLSLPISPFICIINMFISTINRFLHECHIFEDIMLGVIAVRHFNSVYC